MADLDIRIPDPDDEYTIRIAPGYVSITDHNKPKTSGPKRQKAAPPKAPALPSRSRFTPKSQLSLRKTLGEIRKSKPPTHYIVLTGMTSLSPKDWKRAVTNLRRRFVENFPQSWFFWRIMPEKQRGMPVLHLLGRLEDTMSMDELRKMVTAWWAKINGQGWLDGSDVVVAQEVTGSPKRLFMKISTDEPATYHHQYHEAWGKLGKRWAIWNEKRVPYAPVEEFKVKQACHHELKRVLMDAVSREIAEIEVLLQGETDSYVRGGLVDGLNNKQRYLNKLAAMDDNLTFLDVEDMALFRQTLREYNQQD
jgi:hypothetical protein